MKSNRRMILSVVWIVLGASLLGSNLAGLLGDYWGGLGGGLGFYDAKHGDDGFFFGPVAVLGFGFTLKDAPLTFGIDYRPMVAFNVGDDFSILDRGFRNLGVTQTYRF